MKTGNLKLPFSGGRFAERFLRDRGFLRRSVATTLVVHLRRTHRSLLNGDWTPKMDRPESSYRISMTSWRPRLDDLPLVLITLLQQSVRPKEILVWLTNDDRAALSTETKERFGEFGVRFNGCDDMKSHKKWLPMIEEGYNEPFIICDDDIIYPREWLASLMREDRQDAYIGCRCHRVTFSGDNSVAPYSQWEKQIRNDGSPCHRTFITGCGGAVVYPDRIGRVFLDRNAIRSGCPNNDDIWLKAAHLAAGVPCLKTQYSLPCLEIPGANTSGLAISNVDEGGNDRQIANLQQFFSLIPR